MNSPGGTIYILDSPGSTPPLPTEIIDLTLDSPSMQMGGDAQLVAFQPRQQQQLQSLQLQGAQQRRLTTVFANVEEMANAAMPNGAVPIVQLPPGDTDASTSEPTTMYPTTPTMSVYGQRLRFRGRNGPKRDAKTYDVSIDINDFARVPSTHDIFDMSWREISTQYIEKLTPQEFKQNYLFVQTMGLQLLTCEQCRGPRGGSTTLSRRDSMFGAADWQELQMAHIPPNERRFAAHTYFLECKRWECKCHISFRSLVRIASMFHGYVRENGVYTANALN